MLELGFRFIRHGFRRVDRAEIRIVHRERAVHFGAEALRHLNRFLDLDERIVHPALAEIEFAQPAASLKIVRLNRQQFFNLGNFFVRIQRLIAGIDNGLTWIGNRRGWFVHTIPYSKKVR
ncbi:hypothetical protein EMGBD2_16240 [Nitrospirota bacterium]|nr:hypothetical protein EMGBD2_16240 [Nitrospirota bacterium]